MATTVHLTTNITLEQLLDAAAQLSTRELEQLADSIGQLLANRVGDEPDIKAVDSGKAVDNGSGLSGVTLPIVTTLIPDSLTLDGDRLNL